MDENSTATDDCNTAPSHLRGEGREEPRTLDKAEHGHGQSHPPTGGNDWDLKGAIRYRKKAADSIMIPLCSL